jgi:hypothetical protein
MMRTRAPSIVRPIGEFCVVLLSIWDLQSLIQAITGSLSRCRNLTQLIAAPTLTEKMGAMCVMRMSQM